MTNSIYEFEHINKKIDSSPENNWPYHDMTAIDYLHQLVSVKAAPANLALNCLSAMHHTSYLNIKTIFINKNIHVLKPMIYLLLQVTNSSDSKTCN